MKRFREADEPMNEQEDSEQEKTKNRRDHEKGFWARKPWMVPICVLGGWIVFRILNDIQAHYTGVNLNPFYYIINWINHLFAG